MRELSTQSKNLAPTGRFTRRIGALIGVAALVVFGFDLGSEPHFVDESAYFSQTYFAGLFASGNRDDIQWLTYAAYDLPPFPKYLIGGALWVGGYKTPGPNEAKLWYDNTSSRFEAPGALEVARWPMVVVGAIGCIAIYAIGVLVSGRALGVLTAFLLMFNPLYKMHARRAMSDEPAEAFVLVGLALFLWCWKWWLAGFDAKQGRAGGVSPLDAARNFKASSEPRSVSPSDVAPSLKLIANSEPGGLRPPLAKRVVMTGLFVLLSGLAFGLSISSKFSGALGLMVVGAWVLLGCAIGGWKAKAGLIGSAAVSGLLAFAVFVALNPFLTAHPRQRLSEPFASIAKLSLLDRVRMMTDLRLKVSAGQQKGFPHNAVKTPWDKASVTAVQGFGRFGPLGPSASDSRVRYDRAQDWGAMVWIPLVLLGGGTALVRGRTQRNRGEPPTSWAALIHFAMALVVVTAYLPMAWDRYMLPIQGPSALLGAMGCLAIWETAQQILRGGPRGT